MRRRFDKIKIVLIILCIFLIGNSAFAYDFSDPRNEQAVLDLRQQIYDYTEQYYNEFGRDEEFGEYLYYGVCSTVNVDGNTYTLEEYVAGVVFAEVGSEPDCPETLKAHAVAARTFLLKSSDCSGPITNGESYQAFKETDHDSAYYQAAMATQGQVVMKNGNLVLTQYTSYPNAIFQTFENGGWQIRFQRFAADPSTTWTWSGPSKAEVLSYSNWAPSSGAPSLSHHWGMSTVLATYYARAKGYSYSEILRLFYGDDIQIVTLADGDYKKDLVFKKGGFDKSVIETSGPYFQYNYPDKYYSSDVTQVQYNGSHGPATIKSHGCGPTSLSVVLSTFLSGNHDPITITQKLCSIGGCTNDGSYADKIALLAGNYGMNVQMVHKGDASGDLLKQKDQQVLNALSSGKSMVIALMGPGVFTSGGHYIVLYAVSDDNGKVAVWDVASKSRTDQQWFDWNIISSQSKTYGTYIIITG